MNFIIANILHCLGGTALYSIGIVYIDSNAMPGPSAFRQGIRQQINLNHNVKGCYASDL